MPTTVFIGRKSTCSWEGSKLTESELDDMSEEISERALDLVFEGSVASKLQDLASTGAASTWIQDFLENAVSHDVVPWQVGEAVAEAILEKSKGVVFPWNTKRDERNPRASLQGADLVGLSVESSGCRLLFGEVKSSGDEKSPPGVLHGKSGMTQQLERIITKKTLQLTLIKWLIARRIDGVVGDQLDDALACFVETGGASVRLVGVLVRDTEADEDDVSARGIKLGSKVVSPGSVELVVLYLPWKMEYWPDWVAA